MNFYIILYAIFVAKFVAGAPYTDVNNDHRPVLDLIQPQDVENLELVHPEQQSNIEVEYLPSKVLSIYDQTQKKLSETLLGNARPIVDTIEEHEKYGNDGERKFDRAIVNTLESVSNWVNKLIDAPTTYARSVSRTITEKLNQIGGRIVGL